MQTEGRRKPAFCVLPMLLWHVGAIALLSLLSWLFGRRLFGWIGFAPRGPA